MAVAAAAPYSAHLLLVWQGDVPVQVEHRTNNQGTYGQGRKSPMQFADFLKALQRGDSSLYMSTQEVRSMTLLAHSL